MTLHCCPQPTRQGGLCTSRVLCRTIVGNSNQVAERAAPLQQQQMRPNHPAEEQPAWRHWICADRTGSCHFCTLLWSVPLVTLVSRFRNLCSINIKLLQKRWVTDLLNILNWKLHRIHWTASAQTAAVIAFFCRTKNLQPKVRGLLFVKTTTQTGNLLLLAAGVCLNAAKDRSKEF